MKKQRYFTPCRRVKIAFNRYAPVVFSSLAVISPVQAMAEQYFNPAFLSNDPSAVADLARFNKEGGQAPGSYRVDIYINDTFIAARDVEFKSSTADEKSEESLTPFFTLKELDALG